MSWDSTLSQVHAGDPAALAGVPAGLSSPAALSDMDSEAFAAFYERSARPLWAYLARVSANPTLADDLLQESYVRFLCADSPQDGEVNARRYLFRIATNLMRDHWRRPRLQSLEELPHEHFASSSHTDLVDAQVLLGPALQQLRPRERQILWLAYAEGYSHREIADVMGMASASIRISLFRARRRIARLLRDQSRGAL